MTVELNIKNVLLQKMEDERSARNKAKGYTNETIILGKLTEAIAQASNTGMVVLSLHDARMLQGWISRLHAENKVYKEHCGS